MSDIVLKYPLDNTGVSPLNLVKGERHALNGRRVRAILPDYGLFFAKSVKLVDVPTGRLLQVGVDFRPAEMDVWLTSRYGKSVCALLLVTSEDLNGPVEITYQAVGGDDSTSRRALIEIVEKLDPDGDDVPFDSLVGVPSAFPPKPHKQHAMTIYGAKSLTEAIDRLRDAVATGNSAAQKELSNYIRSILAKAEAISGTGATGAFEQHTKAANPHPELALASDVMKQLAPVRKPLNMLPPASKPNIELESKFIGSRYQSLYGVAQKAAQFQVSLTGDFTGAKLYDVTLGPVLAFKPPSLLSSSTTFYWRVRYQDIEDVWSEWSVVTSFSTAAISIKKPVLTSPKADAETGTETPLLSTSDFAITGATDTHVASDWEVWTGPGGTGTRVWASVNDLLNKLSINVAPGIMVQGARYYARARHRGSKYGYSEWAGDVSFIVKWDPRPSVIGQTFGGGFYAGDIVMGVGTYAVILAPKANDFSAALTNTTAQTNNTSEIDSAANTTALIASAIDTDVVKRVRAMNIGGFSDWQVPARAVLTLLWNNLRPSLAAAPAAFKTGGAEAFLDNVYYWSSTAYNYTTSYSDPSTPIYGNKEVIMGPYSESGWYGPSDPSSPAPYCYNSTVVNSRVGYFFTVRDGQPGSINTTTWSCRSVEYGIVGYSPGQTYTSYWYQVRTRMFGSANNESYNSKTTASYRCRPVRLVRVL